jgi:hypothetical protein
MARKERVITIQDREQELTFKIREMPASKLESWVGRASMLIAGSASKVPNGFDVGRAGALLAEKGLMALASIDSEKARPLLDELLGCCSRLVERVEERCTPDTVDNYILDVTTLLTLRLEALRLNLGFFAPAVEMLSDFLGKASTAGR